MTKLLMRVPRGFRGGKGGLAAAALLAVVAAPAGAWAATYHYFDWMTADLAARTPSGGLTLPPQSTAPGTFAALNPHHSAGNTAAAPTPPRGPDLRVAVPPAHQHPR